MATMISDLEVSPEEYLVRERQAEYRHEYVAGKIFAMSGATRRHNLISVNVSSEIRNGLKGRPCEAYAADMRVRLEGARFYTYPDVVAVCGEPHFEDGVLDTLLNPTVIVETLSPTTEGYDRGEKFAYYRQIVSLQDYVLLSQDRIRVEHYTRQGEFWLYVALERPEDTLHLASIGCRILLAEIYDKVTFGADPDPPISHSGVE
ncbi:MAG: Uma2 family endonuclease [Chthonomonadales bacterium]|nr:Uma2 family endonuclease [Chthonomonadales bacterium]